VQKLAWLMILMLTLNVLSGCLGMQELQATERPEPIDTINLVWQECEVEDPEPSWRQAEQCFGYHHSVKLTPEEKRKYASGEPYTELQLLIGADKYSLKAVAGSYPQQRYTLYKNTMPVYSLEGMAGAFSPNVSLQNITGKTVWEYVAWEDIPGAKIATIIYDGVDLRDMYALDAAYRPYNMANQLLFVGQVGQEYFVMYAGEQLGASFDEILIAYCCEPAAYSVHMGGGHYVFWGRRGEELYVVDVSIPVDSNTAG